MAKVAESHPVTGKAAPARREIIARSFRATLLVPRPSAVAGSRVVLVDDVCSSGGTLRTVGTVLRDAGAEEVSAVVLARARWRGTGHASNPGARRPARWAVP